MILKPAIELARKLYGSLSTPLLGRGFNSGVLQIALSAVAPLSRTEGHCHIEHELFVVLSGQGIFVEDGARSIVTSGDVAYARALSLHYFENSDPGRELTYIKIWWDNRMDATNALQERYSTMRGRSKNTLVTATPPTPNGDLHIGHLAGPYLRADVYSRFLRQREQRAIYVTGIDDHQSYVALKAERINKLPPGTADTFGAEMISTLHKARIAADWISQPRSSRTHIEFTSRMFLDLWNKGELLARSTPAPYCTNCSAFLFEAYISGSCPHCRVISGGNACEVCGRPNDCSDLGSSTCNRCGAKPVTESYERIYFPLSRHRASLTEYWNSAHMGSHLHSLCKKMLADGLPDIAVSHSSNWGIPVPVSGYADQTIYVWFEMAAGYLAATLDCLSARFGSEILDDPWHSKEWEIVQFFGYDNGYFHAVLFPALLKCFDPTIRCASTFVTNEFYRLDGKKFSTSRNHAIWGQEFLERTNADAARMYLAYTAPEVEETSFNTSEFSEFVLVELSGRWNGWLRELTATVHREHAGVSPPPGLWTDEHVVFYSRLRDITQRCEQAYSAQSYSLQEVARLLCEVVRISRDFSRSQAYWINVQSDQSIRRTGVVLQLSAARLLSVLSAPLMPEFAQSVWKSLGLDSDVQLRSWDTASDLIGSGMTIANLTFAPFDLSDTACDRDK